MKREEEILGKVRDAVVNLDIDGVQATCREAIDAGIPGYKVLIEGMGKGMEIVGRKYEEGEYFLSELIMAGETMKEGVKVLKPHLKEGDVETVGKAVVGTASGDLHDIGKNIFVTLMSAAGFDVVDLGVDVQPRKFVEAVSENRPDIVGISALLTTTMVETGKVIEELKKAGLRETVRIILGGAPMTKQFAEKIGADAGVTDAVEGVAVCKSWVANPREETA